MNGRKLELAIFACILGCKAFVVCSQAEIHLSGSKLPLSLSCILSAPLRLLEMENRNKVSCQRVSEHEEQVCVTPPAD